MSSGVTNIPDEYLKVEQFADRLQLSRSKAYDWIAQGKLVVGEHVLHLGGVIRIVWNERLIHHLLELSKDERGTAERPVLKKDGKGGRNRIAFDRSSLVADQPVI